MLWPMVIVALLLAAYAVYLFNSRDPNIKPSAELLQSLLTVGAILLTGYWYFVERKGMPHADVTQRVEVHPVTPSTVAVEVFLDIKNVGSQLLKVETGEVRLQQVSPSLIDVDRLARLKGDGAFRAKDPGDPEEPPTYDLGELNWPTIRWFRGRLAREIEPGETDEVVVSFLIPCGVQQVRIASYLDKDAENAWSSASWADVKPACEKGQQLTRPASTQVLQRKGPRK